MIQSKSATLSSTTINYLSVESKHKDRSLLFLHGFPETSWSWEFYLNYFADKYNLYAPDLPGYNFSPGLGEAKNYTIENLVNVLNEFIETCCAQKPIHVIAHDWGGVLAWPLAAFYATNIASLTILNAAHPSCFTREMLSNERQQQASSYISTLVSDNGFDATSKNQHQMLKGFYGKCFNHLSKQQQQSFVKQWQHKKSMENAFSYYKNMPSQSQSNVERAIKIPRVYIKVPTMVLWGMKDTAFVHEVLNGMEQWIDNLQIEIFDDDDHWLHHRRLNEVASKIDSFVSVTG
ncbi:alpha/beta fold hydrolase [Glaciecola sp. 1036]|uniref:alpha/beta fold hydrolase n=1 Tax=Alteromonadaceae TaxID=72275 RepID=UPI003D0435B6